jgi:molybdopterin-guanine dinucleotide biosynthesis protein A
VAPERLTGVLLVGGESKRFGSPKALARLGGETLAERGWRTLGEACDERIAVGKLAHGLELPFPVVDDGSPLRAPIAGVAGGLAAARYELCLVLPVDSPLVTADVLASLAEACAGADAAVPQTGPLPGAYRKTALPALQRRLAAERLSLRGALAELDTRTVELDEALLANVNTPDDLQRLLPASDTALAPAVPESDAESDGESDPAQ